MATAAAAANARTRREIQHHFFSRDAVRPDSAVDFEPQNRLQQRQFERMRERGIIHADQQGRYWLDVVAYDIDLTARYHRVKIGLAVALVAMAIAFLIGFLRH